MEDKGQYSEGCLSPVSKGIDQLSDTEPIIYQLLARRTTMQKLQRSIAAYCKTSSLAQMAVSLPAIVDQRPAAIVRPPAKRLFLE